MKTVIITIVFMLLFTGRTYREKELEILKREYEIEQKKILFDSLYTEGLRLEHEIEVIESEVDKIKKNKYYEKQRRRVWVRQAKIDNEKL